MSFGISIKNSDGFVVADATYKNYAILEQLTVNMSTLPWPGAFSDFRIQTIQDRGSIPLVFVRTNRSNGFVCLKQASRTQLYFSTFGPDKKWSLITFEVLLAYPIYNPPVFGNSGIRIYDQSAQVVFDSRWNLPRVGAICVGGSFVDSFGAETIITHNLNKSNIWFCANSIGNIRKFTLSGGYYWGTASNDANSLVYTSTTTAATYSAGGTVFTQQFRTPVLLND